MSDILIRVENVAKVYTNNGKEVRAVNGLTIEFARGKSVAIVGQSGAGKSTLLHMLGGIDKPTLGRVAIDGVDVYNLPDSQRARMRNKKIGFVFQFYHLLNEFKALENVMMPALIIGSGGGSRAPKNERVGAREKAAEALRIVGLADRIHHKPSELSGGESQRVAIARAMINDPEILLCDEPTGNLDSKSSELIYQLLFKLSSIGITLLIVTHDESLSRRTDQTIRLKDGLIV